MKRIISILLAMMMLLSLAACGDNNTTDPDKDNPGVSQSGGESTDTGGDTKLPEAVDIPVDKYPFLESLVLPDNAVATSIDDEWYADDGVITIIVKPITTSEQVDAYKDKLKAAGFTDAEVSGFVSPDGKFEMSIGTTWIEASGYIDLTIYAKNGSQTDNQGGEENNSGTTEPDNTSNNSAGNNEGDTWTVENFLKLYGFNAEDIKPNHFTSFEELKMADSKEPGKKGSMGSVTINVEKGKTTADDFNAWFESLYAKMTELSDDGKLYYSAAKTVEATPLSELQSGVLWADMPGGLCVITTNVDGSAMTISISSKYDVELEQYSISITVMSVA